MNAICLYFQVHQPFRLNRFHFFDMGGSKPYFDEKENKRLLKQASKDCYLPANALLSKLLSAYPNQFKVAFSFSGVVLDQLEKYEPETLESFRKLASHPNVEVLCETHAHSLASLFDEKEFEQQVIRHKKRLKKLFGIQPKSYRNTELIHNERIAEITNKMGFNTLITEGGQKTQKWKSPNFLYRSTNQPDLNILMRNVILSDDIAFRFADKDWDEYPLTAEKFVHWMEKSEPNTDVINLFMDYETLGEHHKSSTGIFTFFENFVVHALEEGYHFETPNSLTKQVKPKGTLDFPDTISWADKEKDTSAWLGNDLQKEAIEKLYGLSNLVKNSSEPKVQKTWQRLQSSDHFYYMSTKQMEDGSVHSYFNPYQNPYDAFVNYMNVLNDFRLKLEGKET